MAASGIVTRSRVQNLNNSGGNNNENTSIQCENVIISDSTVCTNEGEIFVTSEAAKTDRKHVKPVNSTVKCYSTRENEVIASLQTVIDILNRDLKQAHSEIKSLQTENEELKTQLHLLNDTESFVTVAKKRANRESVGAFKRHQTLPVPVMPTNRYEILRDCELKNPSPDGGGGGVQIIPQRRKRTNKQKVVVLGDSMLKFAGDKCREAGHDVYCFPGIKIEELKHQVESLRLDNVVAIHVGSNNIQRGVQAEEIMGDTMDLIDHIRKQNPRTQIIISGILQRRDVSWRRIRRINEELDWLCVTRNCLMVDGNCWIGNDDIARDGIHLNRNGSSKFGRLLCDAINSCQGN